MKSTSLRLIIHIMVSELNANIKQNVIQAWQPAHYMDRSNTERASQVL